METEEERNQTIQDLLEEVFLSELAALEEGLCGHDDTEKGFYSGALAAVQWMRKGTAAIVPGSCHDVALRLEQFVAAMQEDVRDEA